MKIIFVLPLFLIAISPLARATDNTNGFIVFEIGRYSYYTMNGGKQSDETHRFKVALTDDFMKNFDRLPSQNSEGTGFNCSAGYPSNTFFSWWLERTSDHRWEIHMWSEGGESVDGRQMGSSNPACTQCMVIPRLKDMDMSYQLSFVNQHAGLNVEFSVRYVAVQDINSRGPIPDAPIRKTDEHEKTYSEPSLRPFIVNCSFQEN
ncbi:MAG TPA: hypothetical protein VME24_02890 [Alphaproteobacteria bacterium]|nr:hypothetical protein [Alphaproteobacteria bacterium]